MEKQNIYHSKKNHLLGNSAVCSHTRRKRRVGHSFTIFGSFTNLYPYLFDVCELCLFTLPFCCFNRCSVSFFLVWYWIPVQQQCEDSTVSSPQAALSKVHLRGAPPFQNYEEVWLGVFERFCHPALLRSLCCYCQSKTGSCQASLAILIVWTRQTCEQL